VVVIIGAVIRGCDEPDCRAFVDRVAAAPRADVGER